MRTITSLAKGLKILEVLAASEEGLRAADLAREADLPSANLTLFLNTLVDNGYVHKSPFDGRYVISRKLVRLAREIKADPYREVILVAQEAMGALHERFNENIILSVLNATHLRVIHELHSTRNIQIMNNEEDQFIPHVTAAGKAILSTYSEKQLASYYKQVGFEKLTRKSLGNRRELEAQLAEARQQGTAVNTGEYDDEVYGVAAPICAQGKTIAALCIQYPGFRHSKKQLRVFATAVAEAAATISTTLSPSR